MDLSLIHCLNGTQIRLKVFITDIFYKFSSKNISYRYGSRQITEKCPEAIIVVALQVKICNLKTSKNIYNLKQFKTSTRFKL